MDARSAAEARRAKILARSKQRIDSLTVGGEWRGPEEQPPQAAAQVTTAASPQAAPTPPPPAQPPIQAPEQAGSVSTPQPSEAASSQQPDEWVHVPSMPASASQPEQPSPPSSFPTHTHHSSQDAAPSTSAHPHASLHHEPTQHAQPAPLPSQQHPQPPQKPQQQHDSPTTYPPPSAELRKRQHPPKAGAGKTEGVPTGASARMRGALLQEPTTDDEHVPEPETASQASPAAATAAINAADAPLNAAVRASRLIRCLVAVLYARSLSQVLWGSDTQPPMVPPLLVLMLVQLAIIFTTKQALLMPSVQHALGGKLHTLLPSGEVEVPAKLAGFDTWGFLMRLSPELRGVAASVASLAGVCKGIMDGAAVFLVSFVLMAPRIEAAR